MPSGSAIKPSDIITFYNGVTAEIINTDAEGRLILADALAYVTKNYQISAIIDIATLTGACMQALGKSFGGIMGNEIHLIKELLHASQRSGDRLWLLPLAREYHAAIKSHFADIANLATPSYAGASTAACFLSNFVGKTPWAHLDIAGPSWNVARSYYKSGATGFGIRLLEEFLFTTSYQPDQYDHKTFTSEITL